MWRDVWRPFPTTSKKVGLLHNSSSLIGDQPYFHSARHGKPGSVAERAHCKKKVNEIPVPSRDVTCQTLPGRKERLGTEKSLTFFYSASTTHAINNPEMRAIHHSSASQKCNRTKVKCTALNDLLPTIAPGTDTTQHEVIIPTFYI